ncbi:MAG: ribbon-helix-helix protein, CopG family [Alphaproteobacteria bacterium]
MTDAKQITFTVNEQTQEAIEELKKELNVSSTAAVLRRALALTRVATQNAGDDHTLTIIDKNNEKQKILLTG